MDRYSNGSYVIKDRILSSYNIKGMETYNDKEKEDKTSVKVEKSAVSLKEIDDKLSSIDSIINDSYEQVLYMIYVKDIIDKFNGKLLCGDINLVL